MTLRVAAAVLLAVLSDSGHGGRPGARQRPGRQPRSGAQGPASNQVASRFAGAPAVALVSAVRHVARRCHHSRRWRRIRIDRGQLLARSGRHQTDAPILGVTYGITNRAQLSATVPFYRASYEGFSGSGLDNVYVSAKISVVDPHAGMGASASPWEPWPRYSAPASRTHRARTGLCLSAWSSVVPQSAYTDRPATFRAVRSSRPAPSNGPLPTGTSVTASLAHSASVHGVTVATTASVPRASLRDACVFVSHPVSAVASVYVGGSRTFSDTWIDGASSVSGGVSFRFASPGSGTPE